MSTENNNENNNQIKNNQSVSSIQRPAFNLGKALDLGDKIFNEFSVNPFNDEVLSSTLGHKSAISGAYGKNRGALSHYNIIEKINEGKNKGLFKLTNKYIEYATEVNIQLKNDLLTHFFNSPTIFRNILEWVPDLSNTNKAIIVMHIVRNKKVDKSIAEETADTFLESYEFLKTNQVLKIDSESKNNLLDNNEQHHENIEKITTPIFKTKNTEFSHHYPFSNDRVLTVTLPNDMNELTEDEIDDIKDYFELLISKLDRAKNKLQTKREVNDL